MYINCIHERMYWWASQRVHWAGMGEKYLHLAKRCNYVFLQTHVDAVCLAWTAVCQGWDTNTMHAMRTFIPNLTGDSFPSATGRTKTQFFSISDEKLLWLNYFFSNRFIEQLLISANFIELFKWTGFIYIPQQTNILRWSNWLYDKVHEIFYPIQMWQCL
jgi:hypothetical protein